MVIEDNHLGARLAALRQYQKMNQQTLADIIGISRAALSFYENGIRQPDAEILCRCAKYFGVSADYLLGLSDNMTIDTDLKATCDYTGLDENVINSIIGFTRNTDNNALITLFGQDIIHAAVSLSNAVRIADDYNKCGYWQEISAHTGVNEEFDYVCSVCKSGGMPYEKYCHSCGAKMNEKVGNTNE